tara:strand:+ start:738 stop:1205 length:468 start_codon:yes stop_codon:yes gene_type:complete
MLQPRKKDGVNGTGNGIPGGLNSGSDNAAGGGIDPKKRNLSVDVSSSRNGNTTTSKSSYGKRAIDEVKTATGIEFTKGGMEAFQPSSTVKNTELDLGKYKNHLKRSYSKPTGKDTSTSTYSAVKGKVMNKQHRKDIESNLRDLNPGKEVNIQDWK